MVGHIRTFGANFRISSIFLFPAVKRPSSFTNVAPRTCGAGIFVDDVALIFFFRTKFGSRKFLLACF